MMTYLVHGWIVGGYQFEQMTFLRCVFELDELRVVSRRKIGPLTSDIVSEATINLIERD